MNVRTGSTLATVPPTGPMRFALWDLGFRPFFLLASIFGVFSGLLWVAQYSGWLSHAYLRGPVWHAHEMLFGYTIAVMAGFLLTAVRNWTSRPTATGAPLIALAALWVGGRVLVLTPFETAAAFVNAAFPVAVAVAIGIPLVRARSVRNYFFVALLLLMSVLVLMVHLSLREGFAFSPRLGLSLALDVVLFVMTVMGGRVIPMFTNNGIPGAGATRHALVEKLALGAILVLFVADFLELHPLAVGSVALAGAAAHGVRLCLWRPWRTLAYPLVWILHAAYAWIVIHLALRGLSALGLFPPSLAIHALTIGAIGGLTIGMMTRTARGHTGRPLIADGYELAAFLLVQLGACVRVFGAVAVPGLYLASVQLAGLFWAAAFGLYAVRYWPVLTRPRVDGKPG
ncbi:MAG TPA: NnrS family protein [Burkholderiales bacterium]|nr:NnrS family protein [Burkholderiales bacterium]